MLNWNTHPSINFKVGIHYAWIVIAIAGFMYMAGGSTQQAFGVLVTPLQDQWGWSPAAITFGYALSSITGALLAPLSGIATDRFGARRVIIVGVLFFILGSIITGAATQVWHIWISYGICLGVTQACFNVPLITAATYWFRKRLGLGVGLLQGLQGLGPGVVAIGISVLLASLEWRSAFWAIGLVGGSVMLGLMLFFRSRPADMGLRPYGAPETEPIQQQRNLAVDKSHAKAYGALVQSTSVFWKLVAVHFLGCAGHAIVIIYIIPIAVQAGINAVSAAGILSTLAIVSVLTRFLTPMVADFLGARRTMAVMFLWQGLPVLMLFWAHDLWHFYLFAVIFGIGYGGEGSAFPIINRQYFGRGPMGRSFGWQMGGAQLGMALGGWSGGILFAIFGNYDTTIAFSVAASVAGTLVILSMAPTNRLLIPNWEEFLPATAPAPQPGPAPTAG